MLSLRRGVLAVAVCGAMLAACSSGRDATSVERATTVPGGASATNDGTGSAGAASGASANDGAGNDRSAGGSAQAPEVAPARAALDTYLDALGANDFAAAIAASTGAVQALAVVRSIIHTSNTDKQGTTTSTFDRRAFDAAKATAEEVHFTGRAVLRSTVSGPAGPPATTTDSFTNVVVRHGADGWRVADATYNDAPLVSYPASASTSIGPVQLTLGGSLAFGTSVAVIVRLVAQGDHSVGVTNARLRINDVEAASSSAFVVAGQPGYVFTTFPRRDDHPTQWRATITVDSSSQNVALTF